MADTAKVAQRTVDGAGPAFDAAYKVINDKTNDARLATERAAHVASEHLKTPGVAANVIGTLLSVMAEAGSVILEQITAAKAAGQHGLNDLVASSLGEILQLSITSGDIPAVGPGTSQGDVDAALGGKLLGAFKQMFAPDDTVDGASAERAAQAFLGFTMFFATQAGFTGLLGEMFSLGQVKELGKIADELNRALGLGRLTRIVLNPLLHHTVALPLDRKYAAQYQQAILGTTQIAAALLSGRMESGRARDLLHQHGLSDEMIGELLEQHTPRLHPEETDLLRAIDKAPAGDDFHAVNADGTPPEVRDARLAALAWKRTSHVRGHILSTVLSQISEGFLQPGDLDPVMQRLGIPADEQELWRVAAGYSGERIRKRLSHGDILFLYEAAQLTQEDVRQWAIAEGYTDEDADKVVLVFALRSAAAHAGKAGGAAAKAAHAHNEHVAYVTDEITGLFGRAPTKAELDFWVDKLDQGDRTKHDFVTELKGLDTSGGAIPRI
jgi:hypothetical protein